MKDMNSKCMFGQLVNTYSNNKHTCKQPKTPFKLNSGKDDVYYGDVFKTRQK